jgi:hypothetical protein
MLPIGIVPVGEVRFPRAWICRFQARYKKLPPRVIVTVKGLLPDTIGEVLGLGAVKETPAGGE